MLKNLNIPLSCQDNIPEILIFSTGGTIAMRQDLGEVCPSYDGRALFSGLTELKELKMREIEFSNLPSPHMDLALWLELAKSIDEALESKDVLGAVVLHGTDLLPECAITLELCLKSNKPVVITGSMRPMNDLGYDGLRNLENAIRICLVLPTGSQIMSTMADEIYSARHVIKKNSLAINSMTAHSGLLGRVCGDDVVFFQPPPPAPYYLVDTNSIAQGTFKSVALISAFPGQDGKQIDHLLQNGIQGLVIEGFGAGNIPPKLATRLKEALGQDIPVLITTRCFEGGVYPIYSYHGGSRDMQKEGAILCGNIPSNKALLILQIALICQIPPTQILEFFN